MTNSIYITELLLNQASFDHVKVGPMLVSALQNLWRTFHMFLDILEFRVEMFFRIFFLQNVVNWVNFGRYTLCDEIYIRF